MVGYCRLLDSLPACGLCRAPIRGEHMHLGRLAVCVSCWGNRRACDVNPAALGRELVRTALAAPQPPAEEG
jgi:hypothetical protein